MSTQTQFFQSVLPLIGAPATQNNLSILNHWATFEGNDYGESRYNPLNTTQSALGATIFNSAGVKNYPDFATGVNATAKTLNYNFYKNIVSALQHNAPLSWWQSNPGIHSDLRTWGTVNFAKDLEQNNSPGQTPGTTVKKKFLFQLSW